MNRPSRPQRNRPVAQGRAAALSVLFVLALASINRADDDGFVTLFNGDNLTGWISGPDKSWVVEDGVITLKREFDGREHNLDYLWAKDIYGDFVAELEVKIPERANSGIFLRTANLKDPVYTGIEIQVSNSFGREGLSRNGTAGAVYDCVAPVKNAVKKPGEWNQFRITCRGSRIQVVLNEQPVVDMDLDRWTKPNQNPDGSRNKFSTPLKEFAREGYFGLQDHGRPVWYRNIRIKRLTNP